MLFKRALMGLALLFLIGAAVAEGEQQVRLQFACYFNTGTSYAECDGNCLASCSAACYGTAAAAGLTWNNCDSVYPALCAEKCAGDYSSAPQADDGLPQFPQITDGQYIDGPGITNDGEPVESNLPEAGITQESQECGTASDGHPMRYYSNLGCYDIYEKEDYCAQATSCNGENPCAGGRPGCIWNGAACVPCTAPSCNYACPGAGGARQKAQQQELPKATYTKPLTVEQATAQHAMQDAIAKQTSNAKQTGAGSNANSQQNTNAQQQYINPSTQAVTTVAAQQTQQAQQVQKPLPVQINCGNYRNCTSCANAAKKDGEPQCGWAGFLGVCINNDQWKAVNESGLKAGFVTDASQCGYMKEPEPYCFKYRDCMSCAGVAGVRRSCQWSSNESKCVPYDPLGTFRTKDAPEGNDIILPSMCDNHGCGQYKNCTRCTENSLCLWSKGDKKCVQFDEGETSDTYFYQSSCPPEKSTAKNGTAVQLCPNGCKCDEKSGAVTCNGKKLNMSDMVSPERAVANAGVAGRMQKAEGITLEQGAGNTTYIVQGYQDGNLLFFIPVRMNVSAEVDAKSGKVGKVEQPWWGMLVAK